MEKRSLDARLRSQPSATAGNRPQHDRKWDPMAVPIATAVKVIIFGGFKHRVSSFRVAGVELRDIATCFIARRKSFCVTGGILLR